MVHPDDEDIKQSLERGCFTFNDAKNQSYYWFSCWYGIWNRCCKSNSSSRYKNDYEVGKRHDLEFITCFDEKGILNDYCGEFAGLEKIRS